MILIDEDLVICHFSENDTRNAPSIALWWVARATPRIQQEKGYVGPTWCIVCVMF